MRQAWERAAGVAQRPSEAESQIRWPRSGDAQTLLLHNSFPSRREFAPHLRCPHLSPRHPLHCTRILRIEHRHHFRERFFGMRHYQKRNVPRLFAWSQYYSNDYTTIISRFGIGLEKVYTKD
jgi:hypothetical protein